MIAITLVIMAQSPGGAVFFEGTLPLNPFLVPALVPYYPLIAYGTVFLFILGIFVTVISLILRYRAAERHEQLQIKWFVWVTGVVLACTVIIATILIFDPKNVMLGSLLGVVLMVLFTQLLYFGLIFGLQFVFQGFLGKNNSFAIVISTLAIAALFQPLRHRLQEIVDRRFYRSKYDATKIIENFSATLRNEVDLSQLSEQLVEVVQETMQPVHVSLWLRKPGKVEDQSMQANNSPS